MKRKIRVRDPKDVVLRIRLSARTRDALRQVASRRTKGRISPLVRHYILEGLKGERRNVLQ